jgi:hypothetical protein
MMRARLFAGILLCIPGGTALGQVYECRTRDGNVVQQSGVPCAPGMDTRDPAREAARRAELEREMKKEQQKRETEAAALRGEVRTGMTPAQVQQAWGNPSHHTLSERDGEKVETWYWRCKLRGRDPNAVRFRKEVVSWIRVSC